VTKKDAVTPWRPPITEATFAQHLIVLAAREPEGLPVGEAGRAFHWDRLAYVAEWAAETIAGDFCEIGCYSGSMTLRLAAIARRHGRKVIAIDPFPTGTPYRLAEEVRVVFASEIAPWPEIEWHEVDGNTPAAATAIAGRRLCFGFADATKEHEDVRAQLATLMAASDGPVCVDDAYVPDVLRAADERARESGGTWTHLRISQLCETWLVRHAGLTA
jgi:hypothetical protein